MVPGKRVGGGGAHGWPMIGLVGYDLAWVLMVLERRKDEKRPGGYPTSGKGKREWEGRGPQQWRRKRGLLAIKLREKGKLQEEERWPPLYLEARGGRRKRNENERNRGGGKVGTGHPSSKW